MEVQSMRCRGIRGATTVERNTREDILEATKELLGMLIESNDLRSDDVATVFFTTTSDLNAEFPAMAARQMGWTDVSLLCGQEIPVPGSVPMCIRILILVNTDKTSQELNHVYIKGAKNLRSSVST
ncbi:MAG: chorismate mutase [Dehalococcoidia bacterium]|nr:chorismate mutase [Dehalococcoidia bacterium]